MKKIEINENKVQTAYNDTDESGKVLLESIFGKDVFVGDITSRVTSYETACKELDIEPIDFSKTDDTPDEIAYKKLKTIVKALNEGWVPPQDCETNMYWSWFWMYTKEELENMDESEKIDRAMIDTSSFHGADAGFGYAYTGSTPSYTIAAIGSRLCLKNRELAVFCGKRFIELWAEYLLIK